MFIFYLYLLHILYYMHLQMMSNIDKMYDRGECLDDSVFLDRRRSPSPTLPPSLQVECADVSTTNS